jgi:hypothetical protein
MDPFDIDPFNFNDDPVIDNFGATARKFGFFN